MKKTILILGLLFLSGNAQAVCSGGFDGSEPDFQGCSEMGGLGDLVNKRDGNGNIVGKRSGDEIKSYLTSVVEDRLKSRGITMKGKDGKPSIKVLEKEITFDIYNQNGDLVYTYTVDTANGVPANEKDIISSRESYDAHKADLRSERKARIARMQALADKIKAEEIDQKAAVGK